LTPDERWPLADESAHDNTFAAARRQLREFHRAADHTAPISAPCAASVIVYTENRHTLCGLIKYTHELLNWPKFEWDQRGLAKQLRPSAVETKLDAKQNTKKNLPKRLFGWHASASSRSMAEWPGVTSPFAPPPRINQLTPHGY
jgi:hypothetical protein